MNGGAEVSWVGRLHLAHLSDTGAVRLREVSFEREVGTGRKKSGGNALGEDKVDTRTKGLVREAEEGGDG